MLVVALNTGYNEQRFVECVCADSLNTCLTALIATLVRSAYVVCTSFVYSIDDILLRW